MEKHPMFAALTPFKKAGDHGFAEVDWQAIPFYARSLTEGGIRKLLILGTTGEGPALILEEREHMLTAWRRDFPGELWVNVSDTKLNQSLQLAEKARLVGAHGIIIAPNPRAESPAEAADELARVANETELPVILYNPPGANSSLTVLIVKLTLEGTVNSNIVGIKNSSSDRKTFRDFREAFPSLQLLNGCDSLATDVVQSSCHGLVTGLIGAVPKLAFAVLGDDTRRIRQIEEWVTRLRAAAARENLTSAAAAKVLVGMQVPEFRPICRRPTKPVTADFIAAVREIGSQISTETADW